MTKKEKDLYFYENLIKYLLKKKIKFVKVRAKRRSRSKVNMIKKKNNNKF
jgi:hypothetical protein